MGRPAMIASPARRAAAFERRSDEARFERAISRMLAPTDEACSPAVVPLRPKAIFRVVLVDRGFDYTRSLIGHAPAHDGPSAERFGPFETERAAHALAKRAAARFAVENPQFVVGVIGLATEAQREPASHRFRAENTSSRQPAELPTCITCGKPTRFWYGRPQRYCPRTGPRNPCVEAEKARRDREDPARKAASAKKSRDRYARLMATPEGRAFLRAKDQRRYSRIKAARASQKPAEPLPTGSVLATASPRSEGYELLNRLYAAVPSNMPHALRMEIISATALMVLEGSEIKVAVAEASKNVRRDGSRLRYAKSIDDCFWLADESQSMSEML
ncbi:hypothetical protein [Methylorubrum thiocyanatum]|uniref:hypothetical protein n=1 Tax=Methylorubrum thiocyanatum TaxID=47958 RepID=UPI003F81F09B